MQTNLGKIVKLNQLLNSAIRNTREYANSGKIEKFIGVAAKILLKNQKIKRIIREH